MIKLGFDAGTFNLVACKRDDKGNFSYKKEVNAFLTMPLEPRFVFNMMKNAKVPLIEHPEGGIAYALGERAMDIAYSMPKMEIQRPMKDGCLNSSEKNSQQILSIMMHGLIDGIKEDATLYYSVPANAVNKETDADYHGMVLKAIFNDFNKDENGVSAGPIVKPFPINEGLALVYAELANKNYTGIGASFGAGMVNVCFAVFGAPVFSFSIVNSGDWIDTQAAKATGESAIFINKEKTKVDLLGEPQTMVQKAIKIQYEIMIQKTVAGIKDGLLKSGTKIRTDGPVDIVIAGGTSSPNGFDKLFEETLRQSNSPIDIGEVIRPKDPLYSVARGCLLAAEASG